VGCAGLFTVIIRLLRRSTARPAGQPG
jgi:hypothetical protein